MANNPNNISRSEDSVNLGTKQRNFSSALNNIKNTLAENKPAPKDSIVGRILNLNPQVSGSGQGNGGASQNDDSGTPTGTGSPTDSYYTDYSNGGYGGSGSGSGSGSSSNDVAAQRQINTSRYNARSLRQQLNDQLASYAFADEQNRNLRDLENVQNSMKAETDRFQDYRNLQNAATGLFGVLGPAMYGSSVYNLMRMLGDRADSDNVTIWEQLRQNRDMVDNAYNETVNQNNVAKLEALANAQKGIRDIGSEMGAALQGIGESYYREPGTDEELSAIESDMARQASAITPNNPSLSGYIMPDNSVQAARDLSPRNRLVGNDYYSRLINRFNGRR